MTKRLANSFAGGKIRKDGVCPEVSSVVMLSVSATKTFPKSGPTVICVNRVYFFSFLLPTKVTYYIHTSPCKTCLKASERTNSDVLFSFFFLFEQ